MNWIKTSNALYAICPILDPNAIQSKFCSCCTQTPLKWSKQVLWTFEPVPVSLYQPSIPNQYWNQVEKPISCLKFNQMPNQSSQCLSWLHMSSNDQIVEENRKEIDQNWFNDQPVPTGTVQAATVAPDGHRPSTRVLLYSRRQGDHNHVLGQRRCGQNRSDSTLSEGTLTLIGFAWLLMRPFDRVIQIQTLFNESRQWDPSVSRWVNIKSSVRISKFLC